MDVPNTSLVNCELIIMLFFVYFIDLFVSVVINTCICMGGSISMFGIHEHALRLNDIYMIIYITISTIFFIGQRATRTHYLRAIGNGAISLRQVHYLLIELEGFF